MLPLPSTVMLPLPSTVMLPLPSTVMLPLPSTVMLPLPSTVAFGDGVIGEVPKQENSKRDRNCIDTARKHQYIPEHVERGS